MNNKQVIKKAIEKALDNGWEPSGIPEKDRTPRKIYLCYHQYLTPILFNHDFARSLFGEQKICPDCKQEGENWCYGGSRENNNWHQNRKWCEPAYEVYLKRLATTQDRIKYLEDYLSNNN